MKSKKKSTLTLRGIMILTMILLVFILHFINKPSLIENSPTAVVTEKEASGLLQYHDISTEKLDETTFSFVNNYKKNDNLFYAWYIIDSADNTAVFKGEYSSDNKFTYTFTTDGTFVIRAYIKNDSERASIDFATVICNKGECSVSLYGENQISENTADDFLNSSDLTKEQFNCNFSLPNDETILEIADGLKNGILTVQENIESVPYDPENIDWDITFSESPNTFQLYLQALNPILYLTKAYEITKDTTYLDLAGKILNSWDLYHKRITSMKNSFLWYDHGTALRADNIIYYALTVAELETEYLSPVNKERIREILIKHAEFLSNEKNYTANHNHGIFQDQALIYCAYYLNNAHKKEWIDLAKERLVKQKEYAFTTENVHVENSPGYQVGVMDLFRVIAEFFMQFHDEFGESLHNDLVEAAEFMAYITKPNGIVAEIGDTNSLVGTHSSKTYLDVNFDNPHYSYAATRSLSGTMPTESRKVYKNSGYYICHNDWGTNNYDQATWMMFKSGYVSKTHKHADDNSFMLYSKGYDLFVDPGWYNYMSGDRYRDYLVSSLAHNTVIVDGMTYSPTLENSYKTGLIPVTTSDDYDYMIGYNDMYNDTSIDRHFINLGDAIILYDNIQSLNTHTYSQLFHASEYMELLSTDDNEVLFQITGTEYRVRLKQYTDGVKIAAIKGSETETGKPYGYISRTMNQIEPTYTIKCDKTGASTDFITSITIENSSGEIQDISNIDFQPDTNKFVIVKKNNKIINLSLIPRVPINMDSYKINMDKNEICVSYPDGAEGYQYNWYVIDKSTAKPVYKSGYQQENTFEYALDPSVSKEYLIRAYIKNMDGQMKHKIIGDFKYNTYKRTWENISDHYPYLNLVYLGQEYHQLSKNQYQFKVNYLYDWNSSIQWYIYKDGGITIVLLLLTRLL